MVKTFNLNFLDKPLSGKHATVLYKVLVAVLFAYILLMAFMRSMDSFTDHDDNPYFAAAKMTAEEGLFPYKDYRLTHMPYFVFVYSLIFKFTTSLTLSTRIISFLSFYFLLILVFHTIQQSLPRKNQYFKFLIGASACLFIIYNPVVDYSFARFTYDIPLMLSMLGFLSLISILKADKPFQKAFLSGLFLGLAIGFRLHFVLVAIPCMLGILLFLNLPAPVKLRLLIHFSAGALIALIPVVVILIIAPREFIFDVFQFHFSIDKQFLNHQKRVFSLSTRVVNLYTTMRETWHNTSILLGIVFLMVLTIFRVVRDEALRFRLNMILIILPFLIYLAIGKILIYQYLYPLVIFVILGIFYGVSALKKYANLGTVLVCALAFLMLWKGEKPQFTELKNPEEWNALSRRKFSKLVDEALSGPARVLTLSPAEIIESDSIHIYKEFVSSPFIWRTSYLVPDHLRERLNIISEKEISGFLEENQPEAIFTGYEPEVLEIRFIEYAIENGYRKIEIPSERNLILYIKDD